MFRQIFASVVAATLATAAELPMKGNVAIAVAAADTEQPAGWSVVVEVRLTNTGQEAISWWSGGPANYPGAEHFAVRVRYGSDSDWHDVMATNGQYMQGSGIDKELKPGESVTVPLAVPIQKTNSVTVRVSPQHWHAHGPVEVPVKISDELRVIDPYRARIITAAIQLSSPPFLRHLAEKYADAVVVDALLKWVTVDNATIMAGVAPILAYQPELPATAGDDLAGAVRLWLPRSPRPEWGGIRESVVGAALKTRSESARQAVLDAMRRTQDTGVREIAIDALRLSPGDRAWLQRVRAAVIECGQARPNDLEWARKVKRAIDWLDGRIKYPEP